MRRAKAGPSSRRHRAQSRTGKKGGRRINAAQLDVFHAIVAAGSATGAARNLNMSQPAVSRRLAELEAALGFQLFLRDKRRLLITPEGLAFHDELSLSFAGIERLARVAEEIRELRRGHLRIAALPALCFGPARAAIARFVEAHPDVKVSFEAHNSRRVIDSVSSGLFDLGIAQLVGPYPGLRIEGSYSSRCVCILPKGHALAAKPLINLADLAGQPFVALPADSLAGSELRHRMERAKLTVIPRVETLTSFVAANMVAEGVGPAIIDPFTADDLAGDRIVLRPFEPPLHFDFSILRPERRMLSRPAQVLLETLKAALIGDTRVGRAG